MLSAWVEQLLKRKPPKLAAVALANKLARIAWKLMVTGETYAAKARPRRLGGHRLDISQGHAGTCKVTSRWCDQSIQDARHSEDAGDRSRSHRC
jgi:hypothetical protein